MRKLLLAAVATAIVALQPTLAMAQRQPGSGKEPVSPTSITTTNFPTVLVLQTIPVSATSGAPPPGIAPSDRCLVGPARGGAAGGFEPIRFVGNVLCLDPG